MIAANKKWRAREVREAVRSPPIAAIMKKHDPVERGKCRWCGEATTERSPVRGYLKYWHDDCEALVRMLTRPEVMRRAVFRRDGGVCVDCHEDWSERYRLAPELSAPHRERGQLDFSGPDWSDPECRALARAGWFHANPILYISLWHCDHVVPLWKVAHLPPEKRIEYFMIDNILTRCDPCHKQKSKVEAAERAKWNRVQARGAPAGPAFLQEKFSGIEFRRP